MTAPADERSRVRGRTDGGLSAQRPACGTYLELLPHAEVAPALASFDVHHPGSRGGVHSPGLPWGWRRAPYGPGALSQ